MGFWEKIRMRLGSKVDETKSFSEPPFWAQAPALNSTIWAPSLADREMIENDFEGYVQGAYKRNGPIFSCILARQMVFSEARFQWRKYVNGRPEDLFGSKELTLLETPWPGGTTGELLSRVLQDSDLAGNSFWTKADDAGRFGHAARGPGIRLVRMRPDWVNLVIGSHSGDPWALDAYVVGILYQPRSQGLIQSGSGTPTSEPVLLTPDEVAHFAPIPDPVARFRGMSWITPVIREIEADNSATTHKRSFFDNAAVPNMVMKFDKDTSEDAFDEFVDKFRSNHQGSWNAYKTLFLMGGADVTPLTHDFRQMEFNQTVGKGEARIAAAAGVPASWVGFSEGLQGSALNSGNFSAQRRRMADGTLRPLWRMMAASFQNLVTPPAGASLWYDDRDIAFLREDSMDRAEINRVNMNAIDSGIKSGWEPDAVVDSILNDDISRLRGRHTGLVSVQMQEPGADSGHAAAAPATDQPQTPDAPKGGSSD
ncbi:phage portal protein [Streptomyces sp. NPDC101227]|uniref:phage portal protein n=1 Tax=Streptomyces sp. NPDC101227 TaxID=3366136 RepID=UPI0037F8DDB2